MYFFTEVFHSKLIHPKFKNYFRTLMVIRKNPENWHAKKGIQNKDSYSKMPFIDTRAAAQ